MGTPAKLTALCLSVGLLWACDDHDHDHDHAAEPVDLHACEHVTAGPYADISAAAPGDTPVESQEDHHLIRVALVTLPSGANGGSVQFTPNEAGTWRFLLADDVPVMLHTADNMHTDWAAMETPDGCDDAVAAYESAPLEAGTPYLLMFGPTDATEVAFVARHFDPTEEDHDHAADTHTHE